MPWKIKNLRCKKCDKPIKFVDGYDTLARCHTHGCSLKGIDLWIPRFIAMEFNEEYTGDQE
jgi:hypothetical protein